MELIKIDQKKPVRYGQEPMQQYEFLGVRIEGEFMGIFLKYVLEISKNLEVFPIPLTPSYIKGVINLRGEILPVISLKEIIGMRRTVEPTRLIILETAKGKIAAEVDSVYGVIRIREDQIEPNPMSSIYSEFLSSVAQTKEGFISIIDLEKLFPKEG